jgi:hypothetical protein
MKTSIDTATPDPPPAANKIMAMKPLQITRIMKTQLLIMTMIGIRSRPVLPSCSPRN